MAVTRGPWIDVHAHPGRCFLAGLARTDPLAASLGGEDAAAALSAAQKAGLTAVTLSTVADLRVWHRTRSGDWPRAVSSSRARLTAITSGS